MNSLWKLYLRFMRKRWNLGLIWGGVGQLLENKDITKFNIEWITNPYRDRWFADPFILDVNDKYVIVLAEEMRFGNYNGRIAELHINRKSKTIENFFIVLELPTHLSFPNIIRKNGKVYVCPENCESGKLDLYEYDGQQKKLIFVRTICNDAVWDATISEYFGKKQLFTAKSNDYNLDIYDWNDESQCFTLSQTVTSTTRNMRMAGALFEYKGEIYCPCQNCEKTYGGAVDIKRIKHCNGKFSFEFVKQITSPLKWRHHGMHTLNEYNGVAIIDAKGFDNWIIATPIMEITRIFKGRRG